MTTFSNAPGSKPQIEQGVKCRVIEGRPVKERGSAASFVVHRRAFGVEEATNVVELVAECSGVWAGGHVRHTGGVMIVRVGSGRGVDGGGGVPDGGGGVVAG
jgi:hypothetical protein